MPFWPSDSLIMLLKWVGFYLEHFRWSLPEVFKNQKYFQKTFSYLGEMAVT